MSFAKGAAAISSLVHFVPSILQYPAYVCIKRGVMDWKVIDHEYAKDFAQRMEAMTPEPLYESFLLPSPKVCLVCASRPANSALYSGTRLVVPLCTDCAADWNAHGYDILKRVRPKQLVFRSRFSAEQHRQ
jgi:hypothetical protein